MSSGDRARPNPFPRRGRARAFALAVTLCALAVPACSHGGAPGHASETAAGGATFQRYLDAAEPYLERYGYAAVFVGVFIESFGVPAPGESLVIASGVMASQGRMSLLVLLVAWVAAVLGDNIGYAIGRQGGRRLVLRYGRHIGLNHERLARAERFFARYGGAIVAVARFFDVLRQFNGVVAGTSGMRWWPFLAYNALGAALWVAAWGFGAYALGQHLEQAVVWFHRFEPYVLGAVGLALLFLAIYFARRRRKAS